MKKLSLLIALVYVSAIGQTKLISHKSHSGSAATFATALEKNLFDIGESNFGAPPSELRFVIDSVILQPDNSAIIISSKKNVWITRDELPVALTGRDTLHNNPLFSKRHSQDSIKTELNRRGSHNPVLINYDNDKTKKNIIPVTHNDDTGFPNKPVLIFVLALLSTLLGFVFFALHKLKSARLTA